MLLNNKKHRKWHKIAPAELKWSEKSNSEGRPVSVVTVTRHTIDNEQMSVNCPVFADDTREDIQDRLGFMFSIVQDRMDDAGEAWVKAEEAEQKSRKLGVAK